MVKEPTISYRGSMLGVRVALGLIVTVGVLVSVLFPRMAFADQSEDSLRITSDVETPEYNAQPKNDDIQEQQLIASLMQVVEVSEKSQVKEGWKRLRMRVTGYCPCSKCCGDFSDGITANNHRIQPGDVFVAADKLYPFGTKMVIEGYNSSQAVKVMDRGGAIKGNRLDLFFHTHQQALEWGVQHLDVLIKIK
ncbi:MAG: 3D domain-containing protein [Planctomycetota bacterium]|jgi:3D (Asp-Asp-Asp) domain-containing protein